jgi:MFS family permease
VLLSAAKRLWVRVVWLALVAATGLVATLLSLPFPGALVSLSAVAVAVLIAVALAAPMADRNAAVDSTEDVWLLRVAVLSSTFALIGGFMASTHELARHHENPFGWLVLGASLAVGSPVLVSGDRSRFREGSRVTLATLYPLLALYLAARCRLPSAGRNQAIASVSVADTGFDVMAFALFDHRFRRLLDNGFDRDVVEVVTREEAQPLLARQVSIKSFVCERSRAFDLATDSTEVEQPAAILLQLALFAVAVLGSLLVLLAVAARPIGLDRLVAPSGGISARSITELGAGAILITGVCAAGNYALARSAKARDERLSANATIADLPAWALLPIVFSAVLWIALTLGQGGGWHVAGYAAFFGCLYTAVSAEIVWFAAGRTHLISKPVPRRQWFLAGLIGLASGMSLFWLLSAGMWGSGGPASTGRVAGYAFIIALGNFLLNLAASWVFSWTRRKATRGADERLLHRGTLRGGAIQDAGMWSVLMLIAAVIPLYAAGRAQEAHGGTLNTTAAVVFLPGLVAAVVWSMRNNSEYLAKAQELRADGRVPCTLLERADFDWSTADGEEAKRVSDLSKHVRWYNAAATASLIAGLGYAGIEFLR